MDTIEIYFYDLNENAQQAYLSAMHLSSPEEANLDVFPIATIEVPYDEDAIEVPYNENEQ